MCSVQRTLGGPIGRRKSPTKMNLVMKAVTARKCKEVPSPRPLPSSPSGASKQRACEHQLVDSASRQHLLYASLSSWSPALAHRAPEPLFMQFHPQSPHHGLLTVLGTIRTISRYRSWLSQSNHISVEPAPQPPTINAPVWHEHPQSGPSRPRCGVFLEPLAAHARMNLPLNDRTRHPARIVWHA